MRLRLLAASIAASFALVACGGSDDTGDQSADAATFDLDFQATSVAGESVDVSTYTGSDLVLWFWAPW
ncbi:MAG: hypothetical protein OSA99_01290 [Acidimicrobiales bacterium]|nr:hypothetical protein [Acidimicrobiales bacterium]